MTPEEFRAAGYALVDWIADFRADLGERPVGTSVAPGEVRNGLGHHPPAGGETIEAVLADLDRLIVPALTHTQHPRYFGWFPANASLSSVLGDLASGGLGALGIIWQSAPALTELEEACCDWMAQLCGLSPQWQGCIQDSASSAALVAMLCARERVSEHSQGRGGLVGEVTPLVVYQSGQAHSSVTKAALLAGFGRENLRTVDVDPTTFAMQPDALAHAMADDVAAGRRPAAVVLTSGSTATTAFDPLAELVEVAAHHGAWVHVDAAMGGAALLLEEHRWRFDGLDGADSLSWNPHKWMGTALDCSLFYVRQPEHLIRVMSTNPSYLRSAVDGEVTQLKDWGVPLGRRFRALKLWFQLRIDGIESVRARLRRDLANAQWLAAQVTAEPGWEVVAPVTLQTVCLRHQPAGLTGQELDRHTLAWAAAVNASGQAFVTPAELDGRWMVRVSIGAEPTTAADVAALWDQLRAVL
ncbi:MAG: pyridoxal phosphate-dependent decarboxylase family protein [Acidimicrobiales bacterium]